MNQDMTQTNQSNTKPFGWKIYFWWMLIQYTLAILLALMPIAAASLAKMLKGDFIYLVFIIFAGIVGFLMIFGLIGLYNYVFHKTIMKAEFWRIFTPLFLLVFVSGTIILVATTPDLIRNLQDIQFFLLIIPQCLALYRFTFKNPDLLQPDPV